MAGKASVSTAYRKARRVYTKIEPALLAEHDGEFVAVEPGSGDYIVGRDEMKVTLKAMRRHPGKKFGFFRVGRSVVHKLRRGKRNDRRTDHRG